MVHSMTGFAALSGEGAGYHWAWEIRSVNGRGLDVKIRLPEGMDSLEAELRKGAKKGLARGNVFVGLKINSDLKAGTTRVNPDALERAIESVKLAEERALALGLDLKPVTAADLLAMDGVIDAGKSDDQSSVINRLKADIAPLLEAFLGARAAEGGEIRAVLLRQIAEVRDLVEAAEALSQKLVPQRRKQNEEAIRTLLETPQIADEGRLEQELAMLAIKADVSEEIDRLKAHIKAATDLLNLDGPVGRKLDFLMQEFNREANTLCSKSGSAELTRLGLDLKTVIDQMREQVQNIE